MMFGSKKRRIADLTEDLATLRTKYEALKHQFAEVEKQRDSWRWQAERTAPGQADALITCTRELKDAKEELRKTQDDLGAARQRLSDYGHRLTVPDVLEQHDVHRKALASALDCTLERNWDQLIEAAARIYRAAEERRKTELAEQQTVVDRLTEQLFDAIGYQPAERALLQAVRPGPAVTAGEVAAP